MRNILILMSYFNRPILVREALQSILRANEIYPYWRLAFGDDGSNIPGEPIVRDVLKDHLDKCYFLNSNMSFDEKMENGICLGRMANDSIMHFKDEADIGIMLADDDVLVPDYLYNLNNFFNDNPDVLYCYSHIYMFNPSKQTWMDIDTDHYAHQNRWNRYTEDINPVGNLDASQVAWRLKCNFEYGVWYKDTTLDDVGPWSRNTDGDFYTNLFEKCGPAKFSGLFGEYKAIHDYQLLWHKDNSLESLREYNNKIEKLAGKEF